jgi:hypothetical protein
MRTYERKTKRDMETAKEVSVKALNLRKLSVMYSVNFMVLQRLSVGSGKKIFVEEFYHSF